MKTWKYIPTHLGCVGKERSNDSVAKGREHHHATTLESRLVFMYDHIHSIETVSIKNVSS
jgi:hypothetical protein